MNEPYHLLVDGTHIRRELKGVGRYCLNVLERFPDDGSIHLTLVLIDDALEGPLTRRRHIDIVKVRWRNHFWHGYVTLPSLCRSLKPDAVLVPYETPVARMKPPVFMVCHDVPQLIFEASGRHASLASRCQHACDDYLLGHSLRAAATVFSNSHFVAQWLLESVGVSEGHVEMAPCAPGADFAGLSDRVDIAAVRRRLKAPNGYILVIATGDPRENFAVVPDTYDQIRRLGAKLPLVVVGARGDEISKIEATFSQYSWSGDTRVLPFVDASDIFPLVEMYRAAAIYLDPSLHEGFGMQVIEAMACGTPVVCSDRGALPEVAGGAALLAEPTADSLSRTTASLLSDEELCRALAVKGREQAKSYSWDDTATQVLNRIRQVLTAHEQTTPKGLGIPSTESGASGLV